MTVGRLLGWTGLLALGYAVVSLLVFLSQRSFIYFPKPAADSSGRLELLVQGQRVLVAHRPHPGPRALIYFGGNAEDVSLSRSALFAHVAERHSAVTVAGRSLGTGPAVHLAATQPVKRLVLLVPFDSLLAVARGTMPWLPVDLLLLDRWDAAAEAPLVRAPTTIVAAAVDRVVPTRHAVALHRAFQPGVAELVLVPDPDHNSPILSSAAFRAALQDQEPGLAHSR
jgi:uncharacterized protein